MDMLEHGKKIRRIGKNDPNRTVLPSLVSHYDLLWCDRRLAGISNDRMVS